MYVVVTAPGCTSCNNIKRILNQKNIDFKEVSVESKEGKEYITNFNIRSAGTIIDMNNMKIVSLSELK